MLWCKLTYDTQKKKIAVDGMNLNGLITKRMFRGKWHDVDCSLMFSFGNAGNVGKRTWPGTEGVFGHSKALGPGVGEKSDVFRTLRANACPSMLFVSSCFASGSAGRVSRLKTPQRSGMLSILVHAMVCQRYA